jgi:hypothetical protein
VAGIVALPHPFHFEVQEEAFGDGVEAVLRLPAIAFAAHAADEAVTGQLRLVLGTGVLAAAVRVNDQPRTWSPLLNRHVQGVADQLGGHNWRFSCSNCRIRLWPWSSCFLPAALLSAHGGMLLLLKTTNSKDHPWRQAG